MVNSPKTRQVAIGLDARGKAESKSIQAHAVFAEICARLSTKQIGDLMAHRVLKEGPDQRPVTRDLMVKAMDEAKLDDATRAEYWERYFGGEADCIPEHIRRRMILAGGREEYEQKTKVSVSVISGIFRNRRITRDALETLMAHESFPWDGEALNDRWKRENEAYFRECFGMNELGARVETLFEMHPNATRIQWVEKNNPPESLKDYSQNQRRIMMSKLRHGETTTWEDADRVLLGLGCSLKERMEVAQVWLKENNRPKRERGASDRESGAGSSPSDDSGSPIDDKLDLESIPFLPQSAVPYPEELASKPDLQIITMLLMRFTGNGTLPDGTIEESIEGALKAERDLGRMIEVLSKPNLTIAEFRQFEPVFKAFVGEMTEKRAALLEAHSYVESYCRRMLEGAKDPVYEHIRTIVDHFDPPSAPRQHVIPTRVPETSTLVPRFTGMIIPGNSIAQPSKGSTAIRHMLDLLTRPLVSAVAVHEALPAFKAALAKGEMQPGTPLNGAVMYVEMHCGGIANKAKGGVIKRDPVFDRLAYIVEELKALRASRNEGIESSPEVSIEFSDEETNPTDDTDGKEEDVKEEEPSDEEEGPTEDEVVEEEKGPTEEEPSDEEEGPTEEELIDEEEERPRDRRVADEAAQEMLDLHKMPDVWRIAEYLGNFTGEESAGYGQSDEVHLAFAREITSPRRCPYGLNDIASALKVVAYCYPPGTPGRELILREIVASMSGCDLGKDGPLAKTVACLMEEPRLKHYVIALRDSGEEDVVCLLSDLLDLNTLAEDPDTDIGADETCRDFEAEFLQKPAPAPKPESAGEKKRTATAQDDDEEQDDRPVDQTIGRDAGQRAAMVDAKEEFDDDPLDDDERNIANDGGVVLVGAAKELKDATSVAELFSIKNVGIKALEEAAGMRPGILAKMKRGDEHCPDRFLHILKQLAAGLDPLPDGVSDEPVTSTAPVQVEKIEVVFSRGPLARDAAPVEDPEEQIHDEGAMANLLDYYKVTVEELAEAVRANAEQEVKLRAVIAGERTCKRRLVLFFRNAIEELGRKKVKEPALTPEQRLRQAKDRIS